MKKNGRIKLITAIIGMATLFAIGCQKEGESGHSEEANGHEKGHWTYTGESAPAHWGDLKAEFEACKTGESQSPVNITGPYEEGKASLDLSYNPTNLAIVNNGHTIQVNYSGENTLKVDGKTYKLIQFHFHTPSEHQINGKAADMVAHLVHQAEDKSLAVVGLLFNKGDENPTIAKIWENIPSEKGETSADVQINAADLLPADKSYYHYMGSLTTPPCSEGVSWYVMKAAGSVSADQVKSFENIFPVSVRPVQPLNGRTIVEAK